MTKDNLNLSSWEERRTKLLAELRAWCGPIPDSTPLDPVVHAEVEYHDRTEIKLSYSDEQGKPIHAYLLLPRDVRDERLPAVVAAHQCAWACDLGKEQVVGKCIDWPDQAYGLELVRRGFVVLAPDANRVGERYDPALRHRWQTAADLGGRQDACCTAPGGSWWGGNRWKRVYDVRRAVDYLCTHPRVDAARIGMIGHSLGADTILWAMPLEPRIAAAAISGGGLVGLEQPGNYLMGLPLADIMKLIAPRPLFDSVGRLDIPNLCPAELANALTDVRMGAKRRAHSDAAEIYALYSAQQQLDLYEHDGGHCFPTDARQSAYEHLQKWL